MNENVKLQVSDRDAFRDEEDSRLEMALHDPDRLLIESLRVDERRRRARRLVSHTLLIGGILMGTTFMAALAGWLTLAETQTADPSPPSAVSAQSATVAPVDEDVRIEQADGLTAQGWQLWQERKVREAVSIFEQAVKLDPDHANAWNGLGWSRFQSGDSESAVTAFEKAVELEPNHPAAVNGLGQLYLSWGEYEKAEKYLTKAATKAPAAHYGLARLYLLTGKYDQAQPWIRKALRQQPGDKSLKAMLAAARNKNLPEELRNEIAPAGKPASAPADIATTLGWQQFNEGKFRAAERNFRRALAKDPENLAAMNGLAFILLNTGKPTQAKEYFEKCLTLEPDAAGPMNGLARCLKEEGKVDEAIALWEKMHKKYPGPNAAAVGLATTYLEQEQFDKALPYFEELVKAMPDNEEFKQGLDAAKAGTNEKASK